MSVWIIQNLCVADLCRGLFNVFPTIITLTTGYTWSTFCTILLAIKYCFIDATSFFVNALVINKLYRCLVPLACPPEKWHRLLVTAGGVATSCIYMCITIYQAVKSTQVRYQLFFLVHSSYYLNAAKNVKRTNRPSNRITEQSYVAIGLHGKLVDHRPAISRLLTG